MRTLRLANLRGRCAFGDHHQNVDAEDERGQVRIRRSQQCVEVTSERTQIEYGPVRLQAIAQHGLQIMRARVIFDVKRTQLRWLTHPRMNRLRPFDRY